MRDVDATIEIDGTPYQACLATVTSSGLGPDPDRGLFIASITCTWPGGGISPTGDYCLDKLVTDEDGKFLGRVGTGAGMDWIVRILAVGGVGQWEELVGRRVWVLFPAGRSRYGSTAAGIASVDSDEHLVFETFWEEALS